MNTENKRIFISDLPETSTKDELENSFSKYGHVSSVEIKERKELGPHNKSLFFAYINLLTDDKTLNQCFRELSNIKWHGQYVQLQIARESFLDRLKRERQEKDGAATHNNVTPQKQQESSPTKQIDSSFKITNKRQPLTPSKKYDSSSDSGSDSEESDSDKTETKQLAEDSSKAKIDVLEEKIDIIVKSNKNKILDKNSGLKIPSVGNSPIIEITKTKTKVSKNDSEANKKRLQSLQEMKKGYAAQKSFIKSGLTFGAAKPNKKIVFGDDITGLNGKRKINGLNQKALFEDDDQEDSDFEVNFEIKEQFQGKSGQKLLELQSKYKNDKRFSLDARFMETEDENNDSEMMDTEENLEAEKNKQFKILEEVLGKKITSKSLNNKKERKTMLKFDPSQPEHSNLELTIAEPERKKKKKDKIAEEEQQGPEVSKEVFYKVPETLKETFAEKPSFSLLSMFGKATEENDNQNQGSTEKEIKKSRLLGNPFKYDSSDDEDQLEDIPHKSTSTSETKTSEPPPTRPIKSVFWTEPFFFKNDDFRLQEGFDFLQKIRAEDKEFLQIRKELKGIVKAKVRNTERKNRMFKKKIGGNKRKKHIRMKKALKR
ncbi:unnamed protein product [Ceutorhynchus assimilis]|uniref:RRM domain-containing protein n=1 Tax=Ceutorhynchus assimilis TaxID=467358 RepID=A0A9N9QCC8_9CUCU|nr:unnamed protein product [Ceutorhynchus assimilis]